MDRAEQSAALAELALNRGPGGGALRDDLRLCGVVVLQPALALLHLAAQVRDLAEDERILLVDAVDRVDPGEHLVEARGAEQDGQRRVLVRGRVELDEPGRELALRGLQAALGDDQVVRVGRQVVLDVLELHVGEVVRLDRALQAGVELLDLPEDGLGFGLLRRDAVSGRRNCSRGKERCERDD